MAATPSEEDNSNTSNDSATLSKAVDKLTQEISQKPTTAGVMTWVLIVTGLALTALIAIITISSSATQDRISSLESSFDRKLEDVGKRIDDLSSTTDARLAEQTTFVQQAIITQTDAINRRLDDQADTLNQRLADQTNALNQRLADQAEALNRRLDDQARLIVSKVVEEIRKEPIKEGKLDIFEPQKLAAVPDGKPPSAPPTRMESLWTLAERSLRQNNSDSPTIIEEHALDILSSEGKKAGSTIGSATLYSQTVILADLRELLSPLVRPEEDEGSTLSTEHKTPSNNDFGLNTDHFASITSPEPEILEIEKPPSFIVALNIKAFNLESIEDFIETDNPLHLPRQYEARLISSFERGNLRIISIPQQ